MPTDPKRVQAVFLAAAEIESAADRAAMLDRECGTDDALRARVEALLRAHDRPDSLPAPVDGPTVADPGATAALDAGGPRETIPAPTVVADSIDSGRPDDRAGPEGAVIADRYRIRQAIGEGGMGAVYLADQLRPVRRRVALKLVKPGMDSRNVLARFEAERQALAMMDHPHIARVLDAGTTDAGRPFFVMELVRGIPITRYCDEHRLGLPERLALFRQVCSAVQHAHQKGIIHRDLKPSNILVESHDGRPVPKVIDFGLAKAIGGVQLSDHSLYTAFGGVAGTPLYMAPEQAMFNALDVDTRADIYALGVVLYELLTGSTPIRGEDLRRAALDEMLRVIREEEPPTPSSRIASSPGLPGLAATRGVAPSGLGRLVRGDLDWIVMKAMAKERERRYDSAIGLGDDVGRFLDHEPVAAGPPTAAYRLRKFVRRHRGRVAAAAMVLLAMAAGVVGTTLGLYEARRQRDRAERRLAMVARMNEILGSVFADLSPYQEEKEDRPLRAVLGERLDRAAAAVGAEATGDPMAAARMQVILGRSLNGLARYRGAMAVLTRARDTLASSVGRDHPDAILCDRQLAIASMGHGEYGRALALYEGLLALWRPESGADDPNRLSAMAGAAFCYYTTGRPEEGIGLCEEGISAIRKGAGSGRRYLPNLLRTLGLCHDRIGRHDRAMESFEEAYALSEAQLGKAHPTTIQLLANLAQGHRKAGRMDRALELCEQVAAANRETLGPEHRETLVSRYNLCNFLTELGQMGRVRPLWDDLLPAARKVLGDDDHLTILVRRGRAETYMVLGHLDVAEPELRAAEAALLRRLGPAHFDTISARNSLAYLLEKKGDAAAAVPMYRDAVDGARRTPGDRDTLAAQLAGLGHALLATGRWDEAEGPLREAVTIFEAIRPGGWEWHDARSLLGGALLGQGKADEAGPLLRSGYEGLARRPEAVPPYYRFHLPEALDRLIAFGEATGRAGEVAAWKAARAKSGPAPTATTGPPPTAPRSP